MKRRTVSADDLETLARAAHAEIELPGPEGGWAVAVINGREYRARVAPTPSLGATGSSLAVQWDRLHPCLGCGVEQDCP